MVAAAAAVKAADGAAAAPVWSEHDMELVSSITLRQGNSLARRLRESRRLVLVCDGYELRYGLPLQAFRTAAVAALAEAGVDYDQTWCGAMRSTSLRLLSNLAANGNMRITKKKRSADGGRVCYVGATRLASVSR